jgi:hypothetical protein
MPFLKGLRMPSTAEEVFTDMKRPLRALAGERRKRFDLESFMRQVYAVASFRAIRGGRSSG